MSKLYSTDNKNFIEINILNELGKINIDTHTKDEAIKTLSEFIDFDKNRLKMPLYSIISSIAVRAPKIKTFLEKKFYQYDEQSRSTNKKFKKFEEINDFDDIAMKFEKEINTRLGAKEKKRLLNLLKKIQVKNMAEKESEQKMAILVNALLQEYSERMQASDAERDETIKLIREFFKENFELDLTELQKSLLEKNRLNLASLLLANTKRVQGQGQGQEYVSKKFAAMLGQEESKLSGQDPKEQLIWNLFDYRTRKLKKEASFFDWLFGKVDKRQAKADVAAHLINKLRNSEDEIAEIISSQQEKDILKKIGLEKIVGNYKEILPINSPKKNSFQKDQDETDEDMLFQKEDKPGVKLSHDLYQAPEFSKATKSFKNKIESSATTNTAMKQTILDSFHEIQFKNMTDQEKTEVLADMLIHRYAKLKKSGDSEDNKLAETIFEFCKNELGITLPKTVNEHFSLAYLLLNKPECFGEKFKNLINNPALFNNEEPKIKLILELLEYKSKRIHEGDSYFSIFFQPDKYLSDAKTNVVKKVLRALNGSTTDTVLSKAEFDTLLNGKLGEIIKKYAKQNVLPKQIEDKLKKIKEKEWHPSNIFRPKLR